ncbi:hypothetical protein BJX68DRAFT_263539 [Aspergillus pseudodeflectus]|uniref:Myb-like DNA-binding domain-containing protein n=1 Tax=Aspergillus pseudodeflectus TaxID=176178 RepID=A0ABR4KXK9_9EURO
MPANSLPDPSLMFLYLCLIHSDYTKIDFKAVGAATGLKGTAARMRHSRLKKLIESGMVNGNNLKPTDGATDGLASSPTPACTTMGAGAGDSTEEDEEMVSAPASPQKKRKVATPKAKSKKGVEKSLKKKNVKAKAKAVQEDSGIEEATYDLMDEEI